LLNTHVDTVPSYSGQGLQPRSDGTFVYGRGACDAKGSVVAMLLAFLAISRCVRTEIPLTLALMVGEENSGDGVERFVKQGNKFAWAIVGEPTELQIVNRQAGYVEFAIEAHSVRCHAFDPIADQSIVGVAELVSELNRSLRRFRNNVHTFVRWLRGGRSDSFWYTRPSCTASILINTMADADIPAIVRRARLLTNDLNRKYRNMRLTLRVEDSDTGVHLPASFEGIRVLSSALRRLGRRGRTASLPSWTDGSTLAAAGIPTVIFGPGALRHAHTETERVRINDVRAAAMGIAVAVLRWCKQIQHQHR